MSDRSSGRDGQGASQGGATQGGASPAPLTVRQQQIMEMIRETVQARGYPPSVREIGEAVGLRSPSSVHSQLAALERGGHLRRDPSRPRAIDVRPVESAGGQAASGARPPVSPAASVGEGASADTDRLVAAGRAVPLLGEIAAGAPLLAQEQVEDTYALPRDLVGEGTLFMLRVRGESMVQAGVLPDDLVVVRQQPMVEQGQMCAALIDGEATVKFFRRTRAGEVFLDPANDGYEPIPVPPAADASIIGKVVAVLRSL